MSKNNSKTLLELAKEAGAGNKRNSWNPTEEEIDLALAYMRGEVGSTQVEAALQCTANAGAARCMTILRRAVLTGKMDIVKKP